MKKNWQLGYRLFPLSAGNFDTPYYDLPEFSATQFYAYGLHRQMQTDFPRAEWRLVEVVG